MRKGFDVITPTEPPTGIPNPACGSSDDGYWFEFEGYCYLFYNATITNWHVGNDVSYQ